MDVGETVTTTLAIGIGFRKSCASETIVSLVCRAKAMAQADGSWAEARPAVLATIAEKDRPVLHAAAAELGLPVVVLPKRALAAMADKTTIASETARACFGIPSVAEAAALAAAGMGARLIVTRIAAPDATCAIAVGEGDDRP